MSELSEIEEKVSNFLGKLVHTNTEYMQGTLVPNKVNSTYLTVNSRLEIFLRIQSYYFLDGIIGFSYNYRVMLESKVADKSELIWIEGMTSKERNSSSITSCIYVAGKPGIQVNTVSNKRYELYAHQLDSRGEYLLPHKIYNEIYNIDTSIRQGFLNELARCYRTLVRNH